MSLIDRDELLEILRIMKERYFDRKIILGKVVEEVKRMPTIEPEPKWIPCSERLPEEYGNYLITTHDGNVDIGTIDPKNKNVWSACDSDGFYWLGEVLAWMPLPTAFREEGE